MLLELLLLELLLLLLLLLLELLLLLLVLLTIHTIFKSIAVSMRARRWQRIVALVVGWELLLLPRWRLLVVLMAVMLA